MNAKQEYVARLTHAEKVETRAVEAARAAGDDRLVRWHQNRLDEVLALLRRAGAR